MTVRKATTTEQLTALRGRYSVQELSHLVGANSNTVYRWLEGKQTPDGRYQRTIEKLYNAFGRMK